MCFFTWARPRHASPAETRFGRLKRFDAIAVKEPLPKGFDGVLRNLFGGSNRGRWRSIERLLAGFNRTFPGFDGNFLSRGSVRQLDCQRWAPWTTEKASKGGTWANNATGGERGKMVYSHDRVCTHMLMLCSWICNKQVREQTHGETVKEGNV